MFGRATITLGIGPHSSSYYIVRYLTGFQLTENVAQSPGDS